MSVCSLLFCSWVTSGLLVGLVLANLMWCLPTGGWVLGSERQRSSWSVALAAVDLQGGHQTFGSSEEQSSCCPMGSCSPGGACGLWFHFPCVQQNSRKAFNLLGQLPCMLQSPQEVFRLWCWLPSCPVYRGTPGMPSNCVVFRGVHKLVISCSIVLCAADLLGGLWLWCQRLKWSRSPGMPQDMVSSGEQTS